MKIGPMTKEDNALTHLVGTKNYIIVDVNGTTNYSTMLNLTDNSTTQDKLIEVQQDSIYTVIKNDHEVYQTTVKDGSLYMNVV